MDDDDDDDEGCLITQSSTHFKFYLQISQVSLLLVL